MCCQAWRIAHPPVRGQTWLGTRPLVHVGFLKSWLAGGLKVKIVNKVLEAVQQCKQQQSKSDQPVTVLVTGKVGDTHLPLPCPCLPYITPFPLSSPSPAAGSLCNQTQHCLTEQRTSD